MNINGKTFSRELIKGVSIIAVGAILLGLLLGLALGGHSSRTVAVAKPAPTVTVTASAEPVEPVVSVPQECLDALDNADEGFTIAGNMFGKYGDGIKNVLNGDTVSAENDLSDIKELSNNLDNVSPNYVSNKEACRAAGQ